VKYIVFDLGGVMIEWTPESFILEVFKEEKKEMADVLRSPLWWSHDAGILTREELFAKLPKNCHEENFRQLVSHLHQLMKVKPEMVELMREVKTKGYKIYILSNMPEELYLELKSLHDFFTLADGELISHTVKSLKPLPQIYEALFSMFNLDPKEGLFIDDSHENISSAKKLGLEGILFQSPAQVRTALSNACAWSVD
jgi:putative hydrolase of the HAD superfamily